MSSPFDKDWVAPAESPTPETDVFGLKPVALIGEPGIYPHLSPDQYFAEPCPQPALTNSGMGILLKSCPAKFAYHHPAIGQRPDDRKETTALYMGSLVHRLALDKGDEYVISPYDEYRSNEAKAWRDETRAAGIIPVKQKDYDVAEQMAATVRAAIVKETQGHPYETEVVIAWKRGDRWCRLMLDVWCPALLLGLDAKTCMGADDLSIDRAFASGYGRQDAWYLEGIEVVTGNTGHAKFGFLFVEKEAPWLDRFAESTEAMRHGSRLEIERAFRTFDACMSAGEWPGFARHRSLPTSWQLREWSEAELQEEIV